MNTTQQKLLEKKRKFHLHFQPESQSGLQVIVSHSSLLCYATCIFDHLGNAMLKRCQVWSDVKPLCNKQKGNLRAIRGCLRQTLQYVFSFYCLPACIEFISCYDAFRWLFNLHITLCTGDVTTSSYDFTFFFRKWAKPQVLILPHDAGRMVNSNKVERPCAIQTANFKINLRQLQLVVGNLIWDNVNVMSLDVGAKFNLIHCMLN